MHNLLQTQQIQCVCYCFVSLRRITYFLIRYSQKMFGLPTVYLFFFQLFCSSPSIGIILSDILFTFAPQFPAQQQVSFPSTVHYILCGVTSGLGLMNFSEQNLNSLVSLLRVSSWVKMTCQYQSLTISSNFAIEPNPLSAMFAPNISPYYRFCILSIICSWQYSSDLKSSWKVDFHRKLPQAKLNQKQHSDSLLPIDIPLPLCVKDSSYPSKLRSPFGLRIKFLL